jgi:hypothetical protein
MLQFNSIQQLRVCLEEVSSVIYEFIDECIELFDLKNPEIISKEIQYRAIGLRNEFQENIKRSDDEIIYILKEDKMVGCIIERRTEFNNAELTLITTENRQFKNYGSYNCK